MNILESTMIAYFRSRSAPGQNVPLSNMLKGIRDGLWAGQVGKLRSIGRGSPAFDKVKSRLPAFMLSGTTKGGHKAADMDQHSGLIQVDIDQVGAERAAALRDRIGEDRHIIAAFLSPSGDGVKAVMRVPASVEGHKGAFEAAAAYMKRTHGVEMDPQCSNVNRLFFVSHDPAITINAAAVPLEIVERTPPPQKGEEERENSSESLNPEYYILHNSGVLHNSELFTDFPNLLPLYRNLVSRRIGKPQRGTRNQAMVEIVSSCYCAVSAEFVAAFAEEFFDQHADVFTGYNRETYRREVASMLAGCQGSYAQRLSEGERVAYAALTHEREREAFRVAHSLSNCESEATMPPPLFFLSCAGLAARLGVLDTQAWRNA